MLINDKMPTKVGILTFMSKISLVLSWVEHEKSFITLRPETARHHKDSGLQLRARNTFFLFPNPNICCAYPKHMLNGRVRKYLQLCAQTFCLSIPVNLFCCLVRDWKRYLLWVVSTMSLSLSPLVSWVRCGTWLYRFLIFAPKLTLLIILTHA